MSFLTYKTLAEKIGADKDLTPGLRFGLFFQGWDINRFEPESKGKREALEKVCVLGRNSQELLSSLRKRQGDMANTLPAQEILYNEEVISQSPFVTGMGLEHPLENGFSFLNPYGLPYLPGSSVKGVVRRAAEELALFEADSFGWDIVKVWWLFGFDATSAFFLQKTTGLPKPVREEQERWLEAYKRKIEACDLDLAQALIETLPEKKEKAIWSGRALEFLRMLPAENMKTTRQALHLRGALCFWDVYPEPYKRKLRVDIMNPHYNRYYQGDPKQGGAILPPGDWDTPNPIYFLTLPAGSRFRFIVGYDPVAKMPKSLKPFIEKGLRAAMEFAFKWLGFGAKTSIGYGLMTGTVQTDSSEVRHIRKQERPDIT